MGLLLGTTPALAGGCRGVGYKRTVTVRSDYNTTTDRARVHSPPSAHGAGRPRGEEQIFAAQHQHLGGLESRVQILTLHGVQAAAAIGVFAGGGAVARMAVP